MSPDPSATSTPSSQLSKKKPGGQPGNSNALRHGFYARNLGSFSPRLYPEAEMRNLLGEAAMLKDYMYFLYNCNVESTNSAVLAETLRALALAGMSLARLLQVHKHIRMYQDSPQESSLDDLLASLKSSTTRANKFRTHTDDEDEDE